MRLGHRTGRHAGPRRGSRRERGAVLVEFAMVAMILVTMLAGTFDLGMAWKASLGVTEAARAGARVGSSQGNDRYADRSLLTSAQAALSSSDLLDEVTRVVVYRSSTSDGAVPAGCKTGSGSGLACNIFTGDQFRAITSNVTPQTNGCLSNSTRAGWCPTSRNEVQLTAEYLGVWVQISYEYDFRIFGTTKTIERDAVMRIEPA